MPKCDICAKPISEAEMTILRPSVIVQASENGFVPANLPLEGLFTAVGASRKDVWAMTVSRNRSNPWGLCRRCVRAIERHVGRIDRSSPGTETKRQPVPSWSGVVGGFVGLALLVGLIGLGVYAYMSWARESETPAAGAAQRQVAGTSTEQAGGQQATESPLPEGKPGLGLPDTESAVEVPPDTLPGESAPSVGPQPEEGPTDLPSASQMDAGESKRSADADQGPASAGGPTSPPAEGEAKVSRPRPREYRIWTDATGKHRTTAVLVGLEDGQVRLRKEDGTNITVPLDRLSEVDREYIESQVGSDASGEEPPASESAVRL